MAPGRLCLDGATCDGGYAPGTRAQGELLRAGSAGRKLIGSTRQSIPTDATCFALPARDEERIMTRTSSLLFVSRALVSMLVVAVSAMGCGSGNSSAPHNGGAGGGTGLTKGGNGAGGVASGGITSTTAGGAGGTSGGVGGTMLGGAGGASSQASGGAGGGGMDGTGARDASAGGIGAGGSGGIATSDSGGCPSGQTWCPGCTPGTGSCAAACPGQVCPGLDAACTGASCTIDAPLGPDVPPACTSLTTEPACDQRSDCHSVFASGKSCGCADAGCCTSFYRCAAGGTVACNGAVTCTTNTPYCEPPYVQSYANNCFEGCVKSSTCSAAPCPQQAPASGTSCTGGTHVCTYQDCAGTGLTKATCQSGTWSVETGACNATRCPGAGTTSTLLFCAPDEVCVLSTSGGGAYWIAPACLKNTCSPSPTALSCMQGLPYSDCRVSSDTLIQCYEHKSCGSGQGGCA